LIASVVLWCEIGQSKSRLPALILHFALVEAQGPIVAEEVRESMSALPPEAAAAAADRRVRYGPLATCTLGLK
jgi:hypothetical protein